MWVGSEREGGGGLWSLKSFGYVEGGWIGRILCLSVCVSVSVRGCMCVFAGASFLKYYSFIAQHIILFYLSNNFQLYMILLYFCNN